MSLWAMFVLQFDFTTLTEFWDMFGKFDLVLLQIK